MALVVCASVTVLIGVKVKMIKGKGREKGNSIKVAKWI
jgi:hypothetical protein